VQTQTQSSLTGLWFGGMILGIVLCIAALYVLQKRGRSCFPRRTTNYASLGDSDYNSLVQSQGGGSGTEAFV